MRVADLVTFRLMFCLCKRADGQVMGLRTDDSLDTMGKITKAVIPVAGLGTRFLPATKALPKEMLPVVDKPAIQYVVEEAVEAGVPHILMVTGRNKNALENHFDRAVELEHLLESKGDDVRLGAVAEATEIADIHYVRQGDPLGLGHAISKAEAFVGSEAFAVLLGDDIVHPDESLLKSMLALAEAEKATVVALMKIPRSDSSKYGIAIPCGEPIDGVISISGLVEKPSPEIAPSEYAVIGRYVLQPEIFPILRDLKVGVAGEIQLTDALNLLSESPEIAGPVLGLIYSGKRFDTGDKFSYLQASVELATERDDLGGDFMAWLKEFVARGNS